MAEVYRARGKGADGTEYLYAVKRILPEYTRDPEIKRMFIEESRVAACLVHPSVVRVYDLATTDKDDLYIVMEFLEGKDLSEAIEEAEKLGKPLPIWFAIQIARDVLRALHHVTTEATDKNGRVLGLIHRDISPHNIFVCFDGQVKLTDFGVAKVAESNIKTQVGITKGKLGYMSPEQLMGSVLDFRSDLYNVGILLFESITGRQLFSGASTAEFLQAMVRGVVPPIPAGLQVPPDLEACIRRALDRDRNKRPATALEFERELGQIAERYNLTAQSAHVAHQMRELYPKAAPPPMAKPATAPQKLKSMMLATLDPAQGAAMAQPQLAPPQQAPQQQHQQPYQAPQQPAPPQQQYQAPQPQQPQYQAPQPQAQYQAPPQQQYQAPPQQQYQAPPQQQQQQQYQAPPQQQQYQAPPQQQQPQARHSQPQANYGPQAPAQQPQAQPYVSPYAKAQSVSAPLPAPVANNINDDDFATIVRPPEPGERPVRQPSRPATPLPPESPSSPSNPRVQVAVSARMQALPGGNDSGFESGTVELTNPLARPQPTTPSQERRRPATVARGNARPLEEVPPMPRPAAPVPAHASSGPVPVAAPVPAPSSTPTWQESTGEMPDYGDRTRIEPAPQRPVTPPPAQPPVSQPPTPAAQPPPRQPTIQVGGSAVGVRSKRVVPLDDPKR